MAAPAASASASMAAASVSRTPTPTPTLTPPSPSPPPPSLLVQGKCQCGDSHPYCAVNGWCYQSSISPHWDSAACKGTCEAPPADKPSINLLSPPGLLTPRPPPPSPPLLATGRCQCGDNHPYCHVNGWCYQSSASPLWDYSCKGGCETQPPACEGGCETQPPDKPSIRLPNRTHLVFNHLPKCAGTELAAVLEECLPTGALTVVGEFARTSTSSQQRSFIVSSIREPCSAYLSLWAYGVAGLGKFREDCATPELYYPPDGNPSASLHADLFLSWLMTPARAVFQKRFDTSFPDPSAVDCWVRVEFLDTDLLHCLHAFEAQGGGPVDWAKVEVGLLGLRRTGLDMVSSPGGTVDGTVRAEYARWRRAKGDSPLQPLREGPETSFQINPSTHDTCNAYFDQNTSRLVMQEQQAIYRAFGYVQCCGKGGASTNQPTFESGTGRTDLLRSLEAPATDWDERSQGRERTDAWEVPVRRPKE